MGSIYEGLLEFRIRIAEELMAVVKGKKTEEVIPYSEAWWKDRRILKDGRGPDATERLYDPGDVYLENDRRERKASGSYYTPDHIVKYIVENTVGPVLEQKLEKLRPRLRDAQQAYGKAQVRAKSLERQGLKPDDPAKVASDYTDVVDGLFDLKVLDPAMGSGHFLVEAVDFICDRILGQRDGFLRAFPWNPVTRYLDDTREAIKAEMEKQGVVVDAGRLTDVNLLKRHVLKRCAYGVDLNPMAVELAKVSLWLDCFTVGAPLSFLDHHLKCGNSLIGTTVQEVETELAEQAKGFVADLFGGPFQGLLSATATIEELRRIPDATVEQAERSRGLFAEFERARAPYKSALDIWVSRHFGNKRAQEYLTMVGTNLVDQVRSGGEGLSRIYLDAISQAREVAREKRFFHWDLEFPEAFVDLGHRSWKPKDQQGFDAVVGNPPYDVLASKELGYDVSDDLDYFREASTYKPAIRGKTNLYKLFICRSVGLVHTCGALAYITPMALLGDDQARGVRRLLLQQTGLVSIESFPQKDDARRRIFPEAKLSTAVFVTGGLFSNDSFTVKTHHGRVLEEKSPMLTVKPNQALEFDPGNNPILSCTQMDWDIAMRIMSGNIRRLGELSEFRQGEINETIQSEFLSGDNIGPEVLRGSSICMYANREPSQGAVLRLNLDGFLNAAGTGSKAWDHEWRRVGVQNVSPQNNFRRLIAAPISRREFCFGTINYVTEVRSSMELDLLLAFLNSKFLDWYFRLGSTNAHVNVYQLNVLPIPALVEQQKKVDWVPLVEKGSWAEFVSLMTSSLSRQAELPTNVGEAISDLSRRIQEIEKVRNVTNQAQRSRLDPESQRIQDVIDKVLFHCYGLSENDAGYIENRLREML